MTVTRVLLLVSIVFLIVACDTHIDQRLDDGSVDLARQNRKGRQDRRGVEEDPYAGSVLHPPRKRNRAALPQRLLGQPQVRHLHLRRLCWSCSAATRNSIPARAGQASGNKYAPDNVIVGKDADGMRDELSLRRWRWGIPGMCLTTGRRTRRG